MDRKLEERIQGYLDDELPEEERRRIEDAARTDPALAERIERERRFVTSVRDALLPEPAPSALRASVLRTLRRSDEAVEPAGPTSPPWYLRRSVGRLAGLAAALLFIVGTFTLFRGGDDSGLALVFESVQAYEMALTNESNVDEFPRIPVDEFPRIPTVANYQFVRAFCKGPMRDGKRNPCFIYKGSDDTIGYFCLDDRLAGSDFVRYGPRAGRYQGYTYVCTGPPGATHLWVAREISPEQLREIVARNAAESGKQGDLVLEVGDMTCAGCADRIMTALQQFAAVHDVWCSVPDREVYVRFDEDAGEPPSRARLASTLEEIGFTVR